MAHPYPYYERSAHYRHNEPEPEWIIRGIDEPYLVEIDEEHPGRLVYHAYIPEPWWPVIAGSSSG